MLDGSILNSNRQQKTVVFLPKYLVQEIKACAIEEKVSFSEILRRRLKNGS